MMITATTDDLNEAEFVSRDVERSAKKHVGSVGWIGHTVKQWMAGRLKHEPRCLRAVSAPDDCSARMPIRSIKG
jgi:hypothetical protein